MQQQMTHLNEEQVLAVTHVDGPALILAGAGSGKTRVVTERILHLLELGVPAAEILAVTFTNKAAAEMRHRIFDLCKAQVLTATFHSLATRILRESISHLGYDKNFLIADEEDSEKILKQCFQSLEIAAEKGDIKTTKKQISSAKAQLLFPQDVDEKERPFKDLYSLYQRKLREYNTLDFDDLLFLCVHLFSTFPDVLSIYQNRWNFLLIDEYQDTNHAQYLLIKLLSEKHNNVFAVGDPDQSIYSWRGANIQNILNFAKDYPNTKLIRLEQNYRSCTRILQAANALISRNTSRYDKQLRGTKEEGEKIRVYIANSDREEADFVAEQIKRSFSYADTAIFYRTNFQSRTFEDALLRLQIPYTIVGGLSFYQRREVKDILSFLRLALSDTDFIAFSRTVNLPKRGLGSSALDKLRSAADQKNVGILTLCRGLHSKSDEIKLSAKQLQGLQDYLSVIATLRSMHTSQKPIHEILRTAISSSRYMEFLQEDKETYEERKANLEELIAKAIEWEQETSNPSLASFLEEISLKSSTEETPSDLPTVKLMTLHNGKGLEFPVVFLVGMEEDLFPHLNSKDSEDLLEEERRLCYVGMTRAKDHLFLTASRYRFLWGSARNMRPSRFLEEIPKTFLKNLSYTDSSPSIEEDFSVGQEVVHQDFGKGKITKTYTIGMGKACDVYFSQENRTRSLILKYAKLKIINNK